MQPKINILQVRHRQQGAVLIVGLLLLVIITILAVSGMNTATTELAMARNDKNAENAFQAAESGIEQALSQSLFDTVAPTNLGPFAVSSNENVTAVINFEGATLVPDRAFSLGVGSGVSAYHFLATATAESLRSGSTGVRTDRDAAAVHTQAFYVVGPESSAL